MTPHLMYPSERPFTIDCEVGQFSNVTSSTQSMDVVVSGKKRKIQETTDDRVTDELQRLISLIEDFKRVLKQTEIIMSDCFNCESVNRHFRSLLRGSCIKE